MNTMPYSCEGEEEVKRRDGWTDGQTNGRTDGRTDGRTGGRTGGRADGQTNPNLESPVLFLFRF